MRATRRSHVWSAVAVLLGLTAAAPAQEIAPGCAGFGHAVTLPDSDLSLCWRVEGDTIAMRAIHPGLVWIGIGLGSSMRDADAIVGLPASGEVVDMTLTGRSADAVRPDAEQNVEGSVVYRDGATMLDYTRPLAAPDPADRAILPGTRQPVVWAIGNGSGFSRHTADGTVIVDFAAGAVAPPGLPLLLILHAVLMVASWGIAVPVVILLTRYFKVTPGQNYPAFTDNPFWFLTHRKWMTGVVLASTLGLVLAVSARGGLFLTTLHGQIGLAVVVLGWLHQIVSYLRGSHGGPLDMRRNPKPEGEWFGDHYYMTRRRRVFEVLHIPGGYLAALAGIAAVFTGFFLVRLSWSWYAVYALLLAGLGLMWWKFARDGRHIRTYLALWGPDPAHPGNRRHAERLRSRPPHS